MLVRRSCLVPALCLLGLLPQGAADAQEAIGGARVIHRDVAGSLGTNLRRVNQGDEVYEDEVITTSVESLAQLELVDLTSLSVGPSAQVKLDRFVYRKNGKPTMVINVARGAFRFVSAPGDHKDYEVKTPTATIGVRGTRFDVLVTTGRTDVALHQGAIDFCNGAGAGCRRLSPGQSATATPSQLTRPKPITRQTWRFETTLKAAGLSSSSVEAAAQAPAQSIADAVTQTGANGGGRSFGSDLSQAKTSAPAPAPPTTDPGPGRGFGGGTVGGGPRGGNGPGGVDGDSGGRDQNNGIAR